MVVVPLPSPLLPRMTTTDNNRQKKDRKTQLERRGKKKVLKLVSSARVCEYIHTYINIYREGGGGEEGGEKEKEKETRFKLPRSIANVLWQLYL